MELLGSLVLLAVLGVWATRCLPRADTPWPCQAVSGSVLWPAGTVPSFSGVSLSPRNTWPLGDIWGQAWACLGVDRAGGWLQPSVGLRAASGSGLGPYLASPSPRPSASWSHIFSSMSPAAGHSSSEAEREAVCPCRHPLRPILWGPSVWGLRGAGCLWAGCGERLGLRLTWAATPRPCGWPGNRAEAGGRDEGPRLGSLCPVSPGLEGPFQ